MNAGDHVGRGAGAERHHDLHGLAGQVCANPGTAAANKNTSEIDEAFEHCAFPLDDVASEIGAVVLSGYAVAARGEYRRLWHFRQAKHGRRFPRPVP